MHAWSPRIDRAWLVRGLISILELVRGRFGYMSVAFGQSVFSGSIEIWTIFYCKALRKDIFTKITFRKNVYADFYGLSDIDSVVTDFDPNTWFDWNDEEAVLFSNRKLESPDFKVGSLLHPNSYEIYSTFW